MQTMHILRTIHTTLKQWPALRALSKAALFPPGVAHMDFRRPSVGLPWLVALLWTIALLIAFMTWRGWADLKHQQAASRSVEARVAALTRQARIASQASASASPEGDRQLRALTEQRMTPLPITEAIQSAWSPDVALVKLSIDTVKQDAMMEVEAKTLDHMFMFIERLKNTPGMDVRLSQNISKETDPNRPIVFKLTLVFTGK